MRKTILMLFGLMIMMTLPMTLYTQPIDDIAEHDRLMTIADDPHSSFTINIGINSHDYVYGSHSEGVGKYGDFQVTYPASGDDQIITFFICDQENYDLWIAGEPSVAYHVQENVQSYSFIFRIPYADTWYYVFKNYALLTSKTVEFDIYTDTTAPVIDMNLDAGATYSGVKEITATISEATFNIDTVRLRIDGYLKDTEYDSAFSYSWDTTQYSNGAHTIRISASDTVGNIDYEEVIVYVSNAIPGTTTTAGGTTTTGGQTGTDGQTDQTMGLAMPLLLGVVGLVVIIGIAVAASRRGKEGPPSHEEVVPRPPPPKEPETLEPAPTREKIITERVLVICPFCGAKTEQGLTKCQNCHADL